MSLRKSFAARFGLLAILVTLLSIVGMIVAKFAAAHLPWDGLRTAIGAA